MKMFLKQKGQSSVEYILLLIVVVFLVKGVFGQVQNWFLDGEDSFLNIFTNIENYGMSLDSGYKYFNLRK